MHKVQHKATCYFMGMGFGLSKEITQNGLYKKGLRADS